MGQQTINNNESGLIVRNKLNENFTEAYQGLATGSGVKSWLGANILSINVDDTKFDVAAIEIWFVDRSDPDPDNHTRELKTFSAQAAVSDDYLTTNVGTWLGYQTDGTLVQSPTEFTPEQRNTVVQVGRIAHFAKTVITGTFDTPWVYETSHNWAIEKASYGALRLTGAKVLANGANLKIDRTLGNFLRIGAGSTRNAINYPQSPAATQVSMLPAWNSGTNGGIFGTETTDIDPLHYDDLSGTLANTTAGQYVNIFVYHFPYKSEVITLLLYGDKEYTSLDTAVTGTLNREYNIPTDMTGGAIIYGISVLRETTDLTAAIAGGTAELTPPPFGGGGGGIGAGYWSKTGSDLTPTTPGDNVKLPTGALYVDTINESTLDSGITIGSKIRLATEDTPSDPTLSFSSGTGLYEDPANTINIATNGTARFKIDANAFRGFVSNSGSIRNETASATNPTLIPRAADTNTGIGGAAADQLSLIAGDVEGIRITEDAGAVTVAVNGPILLEDATIEHENVTHDPIYLSGQTGLDDLSSSGLYSLTGSAVFQIRIDGVGSPNTFEWRKGTSGGYTSSVAMTGSAQLLQDGISITWAAIIGHTNNDEWEMNVGHEVHIDEAVHVNSSITADGDVVVAGTLRSLSPLKIQEGIEILCDRPTDTAEINTTCTSMALQLNDATKILIQNSGITLPVPQLISSGTNTPTALLRSSAGQWSSIGDGTDIFGFYNRAGTPEGNIAADIGSYCVDTANGEFYIKTTDTVNTGWKNLTNIDVSSEGLLLAMNFNSNAIDGTTVLDSSGENNHGNVTGAIWSATSGFNGGGAYTFNGSSDEIVTKDILTNTAFTVSAWVRSDDVLTQRQAIFEKNLAASTGFMLEINAGVDGKAYLFNGYSPLVSNRVLANNTWYHIVGTYDGLTSRIYINGALDNSIAATFGSFGTEALKIGHGSFPGDSWFNGTIDEPRVYNKALTHVEVAQLYYQRTESQPSFVPQKDAKVNTAGEIEVTRDVVKPNIDIDFYEEYIGSIIDDSWAPQGTGATFTMYAEKNGSMRCQTASVSGRNSFLDWGYASGTGVLDITPRLEMEHRRVNEETSNMESHIAMIYNDDNNSIAFRYASAEHANFRARVRVGGVDTFVDTGVAADTSYHVFKIITDDTNCTFYIDDSQVAQIATPAALKSLLYQPRIGQVETTDGVSKGTRTDYVKLVTYNTY